MNEFLKAIKTRRSVYAITNESPLSDELLLDMIKTTVANVPSAFNSQTARVLLLTGASHKKLWDITLKVLNEIVPAAAFLSTQDKIAGFAAGHGTILYFEEQDTIKALQTKFPLYSDSFPVWSQQSAGMLQLAIWTALSQEGLGASLQHYNPIIDAELAKAFNLADSWKLIAEMPFGTPSAEAGEKSFLPIEERVRALG